MDWRACGQPWNWDKIKDSSLKNENSLTISQMTGNMTLAVATLEVICVTTALISTKVMTVMLGCSDILAKRSANTLARPDFYSRITFQNCLKHKIFELKLPEFHRPAQSHLLARRPRPKWCQTVRLASSATSWYPSWICYRISWWRIDGNWQDKWTLRWPREWQAWRLLFAVWIVNIDKIRDKIKIIWWNNSHVCYQ